MRNPGHYIGCATVTLIIVASIIYIIWTLTEVTAPL